MDIETQAQDVVLQAIDLLAERADRDHPPRVINTLHANASEGYRRVLAENHRLKGMLAGAIFTGHLLRGAEPDMKAIEADIESSLASMAK